MKTIEEILNIKNGTIHSISWRRNGKVKKSCTDSIEKEVSATGLQISCSYDNLKRTKEGRANGELPEENSGLKGFEWVAYPTILRATKSGKLYLRIETTKNSRFNTTWYKNGINITKELIEHDLLASEKSHSDEMPTVLNVAIENIIDIK